VDIHDERRSEDRSTLHRTWNVSVECEAFGSRQAQVLDYSSSGIKLSMAAVSGLEPGARLEIHHPGTSYSYVATVAWCDQQTSRITLGAELVETAAAMQQAC
jgi:hypothetical protein